MNKVFFTLLRMRNTDYNCFCFGEIKSIVYTNFACRYLLKIQVLTVQLLLIIKVETPFKGPIPHPFTRNSFLGRDELSF